MHKCVLGHMFYNVCVEVREQQVEVSSLPLPCAPQGFTKDNRHLYPLHYLTCPVKAFINRKQTNS